MGMKDLTEGMKNQGYDKEEEYFKRKEREAIEKLRREKEKRKSDNN